jgi:hypothetical protein
VFRALDTWAKDSILPMGPERAHYNACVPQVNTSAGPFSSAADQPFQGLAKIAEGNELQRLHRVEHWGNVPAVRGPANHSPAHPDHAERWQSG